MTASQRQQLRLSEIRQRLNEIGGLTGDAYTDAIRTEERALQTEYAETETRYRSALIAEDEETRAAEADLLNSGGDAETRELRELTGRARLGAYFNAAIEQRAVNGAEAELATHYQLEGNQFPVAMLRSEQRAVATIGTDQAAQAQQPIIPHVFSRSVMEFLSIPSPIVGVGEQIFPVLTNGADVGGPHTDGTAAAETTAAFAADALQPSRLTVGFSYLRGDSYRLPGIDDALRRGLADALGNALDYQVIRGTNGLLGGTNLTANAASAVDSVSSYLSRFVLSRVDGAHAGDGSDIRLVFGSATYAHAGSVFRGTASDQTGLDALMRFSGGLRVSGNMPAVASSKQNAIVRVGNLRDMVAPVWQGVTVIPDIVTKAREGTVLLTAEMLHAVKILRAGGFAKVQAQHA